MNVESIDSRLCEAYENLEYEVKVQRHGSHSKREPHFAGSVERSIGGMSIGNAGGIDGESPRQRQSAWKTLSLEDMPSAEKLFMSEVPQKTQ